MTVLQICSPGSRQRADCSLTRGVDAEGCATLNARDGAVENDRATIPQERQCLLHRKQRSPYIDVEQLVEMLFGDGPKGNKFANAGVGENNIDSPLHLRDGLVETIKVGRIGNVSLNARNVAADCLYGLVEFLLATARDEDVGALFDEKFCRSQPNPFGAACDEGDLVFKLFGHSFSPLLPSCHELSCPDALCASVFSPSGTAQREQTALPGDEAMFLGHCPVNGCWMIMRPFGRINFPCCCASIAEDFGIDERPNGCRATSEYSRRYPRRTSCKVHAIRSRYAALPIRCPASGRGETEAAAQCRMRRSPRRRAKRIDGRQHDARQAQIGTRWGGDNMGETGLCLQLV